MTIQELEAQIRVLIAQLQELQYPQNTTTTGPGINTQGIKYLSLWEEMERQKVEDQDPKASALLELRKEIKDEILLLKKDGEKYKKDLEEYQKSLKTVNNLIIGIVVVVSIAFITTLSLVFFDLIKEKDLLLNYNNFYQNYSEKNMKLNDKLNE